MRSACVKTQYLCSIIFKHELEGYSEYLKRVKWRIIPFVF